MAKRVSDRTVNHLTGPASDGYDLITVALAFDLRDCRDECDRLLMEREVLKQELEELKENVETLKFLAGREGKR